MNFNLQYVAPKECEPRDPKNSLPNLSMILKGLRLLIVEDEPASKELFVFIFEESGAETIAVSTVAAALDRLERCQPDILVSNMKMPDGDGLSLIKRVRASETEIGKNIPAVIVTGVPEWEYGSRARSAGFQEYITKPVDPDRLVMAVARLAKRVE